MEEFLSNAGNIMVAAVMILFGFAGLKLWRQSRGEDGGKGSRKP